MDNLFEQIISRHSYIKINIYRNFDSDSIIINIYENNKIYNSFCNTNNEYNVDDIYIGRVNKIVNNLGYSFVDIGHSKSAFLSLNEKSSFNSLNNTNLKQGDKVLVQIKKEAYDYKGPYLTRDIKIPGDLVMYMPYNNYIGISSRINDLKLKNRLKGIGEKLTEGEFGIVFRKNSETASINEITRELNNQIEVYKSFKDKFINIKPPCCVFKNTNSISNIINEFVKLSKNIIINFNDQSIVDNISNEIYGNKILFEYCQDLKENYYDVSLKKKIVLDDGSNIIIDKCEALTVFDVNSADISLNNKETFLDINMIAAEEIARQIRLNNISGIILIDFINMSVQDEEILKKLCVELFNDDPIQMILHGFTHTGLMEITRKRTKG